MKIDAHQHFWVYKASEYDWINEDLTVLKRDFLPEEFKSVLGQEGMQGSILIQARQSLEETEWILKWADQYDFIKGVVGWFDLNSDHLLKQIQQFRHPKLVGVRHVIQDEKDDYFMLRDSFQRGVSQLQTAGLTYDLLILPRQLPIAEKLVSNFPRQRFVLDHMAKPDIKNQVHQPWGKQLEKLASHENVYCKLSGMITEADWSRWDTPDFEYYLSLVFSCFGKDRLMFGSDWPVCNLAGDYFQVVELIANFLQKLELSESDNVWGNNCMQFYQIKPDPD